MNPGRELDYLVAEKVMGWRLLNKNSGMNNDLALVVTPGWYGPGQSLVMEKFEPSTDIQAAWQVVEKLRSSRPEYVLLLARNFARGKLPMHYYLWRLS